MNNCLHSIMKCVALIGFISLGATQAAVIHAGNADVFLTEYINSLNEAMPPSGNPADVADLYAIDAQQIHVLAPPDQRIQNGQAEIRQFFAGFKDAFADWTHVEKSRMTHGNSAVWEGIAQGHHRETGKPIRVPIVFFIEFDNDGAVRENRVYVDGRSVGDQLK